MLKLIENPELTENRRQILLNYPVTAIYRMTAIYRAAIYRFDSNHVVAYARNDEIL